MGRRHRGLQLPGDRQPAHRGAGRLFVEHAGDQGLRFGDQKPLLDRDAQCEVELAQSEDRVVLYAGRCGRFVRQGQGRGDRATNPRCSPSRCRPSASRSGDASRLMPRRVSAPRAVCWSVRVTASDRPRHEKACIRRMQAFSLRSGLCLCLHRFLFGHHAARRAEEVEIEVPGDERQRLLGLHRVAGLVQRGERTPPRPSRPARRP